MTFFSSNDFEEKYNIELPENDTWKIEASCEMIYSQVGLNYRNPNWNRDSVPTAIKNASMEQLRFMIEHDIPFVDYDKSIRAGDMSADLKSDYSTLALRILGNNGYLYRGSRMSDNMGLDIPFGGE